MPKEPFSALLGGIGDLKRRSRDHGAFEKCGIIVLFGNVSRLGVAPKANADTRVGPQQLQLPPLEGAVEEQIVPHPHQGQGDTVGDISPSGTGCRSIFTVIDHAIGKGSISLGPFVSCKTPPDGFGTV